MTISGKTKVLGIFGHPVEHSLSPVIQNVAIDETGLPLIYIPFSVEPVRLKDAVESIRALNLAGVNITIPHKETVMEYLDEISEEANVIGAVNTVVNSNGRLIGHNTDGAGYLTSLTEETGFNPAGKSVLIIGAGGAARGVVCALAQGGVASLLIANRTLPRGEQLASDFTAHYPDVTFSATTLDPAPLEHFMDSFDLVVNTTSLGMEGRGQVTLPLDALPEGAVVSDIVYKPHITELLKRAGARGLRTHGGLGMLVCQGALGFTLWTGREAPLESMRKAAEEALDR